MRYIINDSVRGILGGILTFSTAAEKIQQPMSPRLTLMGLP
jgi:hypothetical protein